MATVNLQLLLPPLHLPGRLQELKRRACAVTCRGSESSCLALAKARGLAGDAFTLGSDDEGARRAGWTHARSR
jgi:hypothetical protein